MSLKPQGINPVPEETARIACTAYPKGNVSMHMRDELGTCAGYMGYPPGKLRVSLFSYLVL
jgi:hypothetical protein